MPTSILPVHGWRSGEHGTTGRLKLALAGLVVAAVAAIAVAVTLVSGPRSVAGPMNELQALLVARDFAPTDHPLALSSTDVTGGRRLYEFSSPDVRLTVDADSGQVVSFLDMRAMPASSFVTVSRNQPSAAASAFLVLLRHPHGWPRGDLRAPGPW